MKSNKKKILCGLVVMALGITISQAADMFGNPTVIGTPGQFEVQIGGGKSTNLNLDTKATTSMVTIGAISQTQQISAMTGAIKEDQAFIGASYTLNNRIQLLANLGTGKDSGQQSSSRAISLKISPNTEGSDVKMGLLLRAQQVTIDIEGPIFTNLQINDGTNVSFWIAPTNGSEQLKYTRMDAFFGASSNSGTVRPYGGLCLSHITGTDTLSLNDNVTIYTSPVGGGAQTTSTQHVSLNSRADITSKGYFTGVLGFSINPDNSNLGMTAEIQAGVQRSLMLSGNIKF
ncbi:MAG: hypothetical protein HOO95_05370 [Gallionella sp.]|nr:hypothetical protein [Gallionella sp.]